MPSPPFSRRLATAVTEHGATTAWPKHGAVLSAVKLWVLAMLAPKGGLRVAPVPPQAANLTELTRGRQANARSGRRNRRLDRTKEHGLARIATCCADHSIATVFCPMVGETPYASHTEIRTVPSRACHDGRTRQLPARPDRAGRRGEAQDQPVFEQSDRAGPSWDQRTIRTDARVQES